MVQNQWGDAAIVSVTNLFVDKSSEEVEVHQGYGEREKLEGREI